MIIDFDSASDLRRFTMYLPDRDRNGEPVAHLETWLIDACRLLAELNGGVTRLPPAKGMWVNSETGALIEETTHVVCSYVSWPNLSSRFQVIRAFIERFRTVTNQDAVAIEFDGRMYFISTPSQATTAAAELTLAASPSVPAVSQERAAEGRLI